MGESFEQRYARIMSDSMWRDHMEYERRVNRRHSELVNALARLARARSPKAEG